MERETYLSPPQATVFLSQRPSQMSPSTHHPLQYTDASSASHSLFLSSSSVRFRGWVVKRLTEGESRGQPVGSGGSSSKEIDWLAAWAHFNIWKWPEASAINQHSTLCHFSSSASFSYFPFLFTEDSFLAFYPAASFPISNPHPLQILPHPCIHPSKYLLSTNLIRQTNLKESMSNELIIIWSYKSYKVDFVTIRCFGNTE